MDNVLLVAVVFLLLFNKNDDIDAFVMKCPSYELKFQKIVGYRPPPQLISESNLLYSKTDHESLDIVISTVCWNYCATDPNCSGYVYYIDIEKCFGFSALEKGAGYQSIESDIGLIADPNAIYYEKTCLKVPESCKQKLWTVAINPGNTLLQQGKKTLPTLVTRRECIEKCLYETEFQCLSAAFTPSQKNNQKRFRELQLTARSSDKLGRCILSDKDKSTQPDAFRAAPYNEEYIENQCYDRPPENDNCSYELYSNSSFIYSEVKYMGLSQKQCQRKCSHETLFFCQGVSFNAKDLTNSECYLHSDDVISMGPRSLQFKVGSVYMRRVKCLDVSVVCNRDEMVIRYTPGSKFHGKLYISSHSKDCSSATGNGTGPVILRLPIGSEVKENRCGILRAYEVSTNYQRIFISTLVVIQNNLNVQTQGDRLIKVGCILNGNTSTSADTGEGDEAIALGSALAFTQTQLTSDGTIQINSTSVSATPKISMHVIDLNQHLSTNDVQVGQNLELQIAAYPPNTIYDFEAYSLVANSMEKNVAVNLIDGFGCPTDPSIFPALERVKTKDKNILRARFQAFKFAGTPLVSFDVKIHFCLDKCPPKVCYNSKGSYGRQKRFSTNDLDGKIHEYVQIKNPLYVASFSELKPSETVAETETESEKLTAESMELPLNYQLHVRGPQIADNADGVIYGENGVILLAGNNDTICINQSLLIALLIFFMIFQILLLLCCGWLMRKYRHLTALDDDDKSLQKIHESLEYYEGRRVRWADQGSGSGYTI